MSFKLKKRVIFITSKIPPEHSGAGKRIYNFFQYLKNNDYYNVNIITYTMKKHPGIISVKSVLNNRSYFRRLRIILQFVYSLVQIEILCRKKLFERDTVIWLTSASTLTFAAAIVFKFRKYKILTQNTLLHSDDPRFRYTNHILNLKYCLKKLQYKLSNNVTCNSPALYQVTKDHHANVSIIPNPIRDDFILEDVDLDEKRLNKNILSIGTLGYRKGTDIVLKAFQMISKIDSDFTLTLVGPNKRFNEIVRNENIQLTMKELNKIKLVNYDTEILKYYLKSSILFLPSRREGFASVFIEAMATQTPVIGKKIAGVTDYIFCNKNSYIFDTEEPKVYADAILSISKCKESYENEVVINKLNISKFKQNKVYNKYINLIETDA